MTKDKTLQPYTAQKGFNTSSHYPKSNKPGYILYILCTRLHQGFATTLLQKVDIVHEDISIDFKYKYIGEANFCLRQHLS